VALERTALVARLQQAARADELTGLLNRGAWDDELAREVARASRERRPLCVVMLDLDHFKRLNDTLGHAAGDKLLKEAALAWRSELRLSDQLGRYGGDEFVVLLPGCPLEDAERLAERLAAATPAGNGCSCGVACWNGEEDADRLVQRADAALLEAKQAGRNQVAVAG
jgi:diguanylate cyclase